MMLGACTTVTVGIWFCMWLRYICPPITFLFKLSLWFQMPYMFQCNPRIFTEVLSLVKRPSNSMALFMGIWAMLCFMWIDVKNLFCLYKSILSVSYQGTQVVPEPLLRNCDSSACCRCGLWLIDPCWTPKGSDCFDNVNYH